MTALDSFLSKAEINDVNGCWNWRAAICDGYGRIRHQGKMQLAHRVSFELHSGPVPAGLFVCHRCDNPICINPSHLFVGTHSANMADMAIKGRRRGIVAIDGERHGRAKLTDAEVSTIRSSGQPAKVLAREYGVSDRQIRHIRAGKSRIARILGGLDRA